MIESILVVNCGSSSIKYALIDDRKPYRIYGLAENLSSENARIKGIAQDGSAFELSIAGSDHRQALAAIFKRLGDYSPDAIGHRVVHGGEHTQAELVNSALVSKIDQLASLAPLHNPANSIGMQATLSLFPDISQVAVFDTAFHQTMPAHAYHYALPRYLYEQHGVRRYGFHGTSHAYVSQRASQLAGEAKQGWLSAHLGNGSSTCAIWNGKSLDTSMGFTPLEGLVMGTRSGDIDPGLIQFFGRQLGMDVEAIDTMLNRDSGLLGLSGLSNDMRTLVDAAEAGNQFAQLAIEVFCYRLAKSMAALSCAIPRLDGIIFTGGIGENAANIRAKTLAYLPHFAIHIDSVANEKMVRGEEGRIDHGQGIQLWVVPTDEEWQIAQEVRQALSA